MKAIMISIKPKWCAKIMNGEKTIEVRKNKALANAIQKLIDENGYADIYVYCSKDDKNILFYQFVNYGDDSEEYYDIAPLKDLIVENEEVFNGKVAFKFRCYKVEEIKIHFLNKQLTYRIASRYDYTTKSLSNSQLKKLSCLSNDEMNNYFKYVYDKNVVGTAIPISNLEIFDRPKELSEFKRPQECWYDDHNMCKEEKCSYYWTERCGEYIETGCSKYDGYATVTKAPQNFCYVEVE